MGTSTITNSGIISGIGVGLELSSHTGANVAILNSGEISGKNAIIASACTVKLTNTGAIDAVPAGTAPLAIQLGDLSDVVTNSGAITGDVNLGGGADT